MGLTALDLGLRGVAVGLVLVFCALLLQGSPLRTLTMLRVALAATCAGYAIATAPFFPLGSFGWNAPLVILFTGSPVIFWLWARAAFDDEFAVRPWHVAIWLLVAGAGLLSYCGGATWPTLAMSSGRLFALASIVFAILACTQTLTSWRADLVARRRVLLIGFLLGMTTFITLNAASGLAAIPMRSISLACSLGVGVLALLGVWTAFPALLGQPALIAAGGAVGATGRATEAASRTAAVPPDQAALRRLRYLMTVERAYRQEGLTIGVLAVRLGMAEHRLRALINDGLGHRNFNAFVNRYRLDEVRTALADPAQIDATVLTIALDAGFQSLGPFNRAFKADTGQTPTEFRRTALAERKSGNGEGISRSD